MKLQEILKVKGIEVHKIAPDATLADVVDKLVRHNCGSLLVCHGDQIVGIITERDILRASVSCAESLQARRVSEHMSADVITGHPRDDVGEVMGLLTEKRIRHLPLIDDGKLVGIISIGDVVKAQHDRLSIENHYLKTYIHS